MTVVDFTREPIIETIITPKEGHQLVIRSSKSAGQEEYFVDAVEIVAFGHALFFRSMERPKAFLVPVSDYEVLEVKEARMILKNAGLSRSIKIGGGREAVLKASREAEKEEVLIEERMQEEEILQEVEVPALVEARAEPRTDKKRDRRRHYRKRRGREEKEESGKEAVSEPSIPPLEDEKIDIPPPKPGVEGMSEGVPPLSSTLFSSLLQPPPKLISETINQYRQNESFKGAFYLPEEEQYKPHDKVQELLNEDDEEEIPSLLEPTFVSEEQVQIEESSLGELQKEEDGSAFMFEDEQEESGQSEDEQEESGQSADTFLTFMEEDSLGIVTKPPSSLKGESADENRHPSFD